MLVVGKTGKALWTEPRVQPARLIRGPSTVSYTDTLERKELLLMRRAES